MKSNIWFCKFQYWQDKCEDFLRVKFYFLRNSKKAWKRKNQKPELSVLDFLGTFSFL